MTSWFNLNRILKTDGATSWKTEFCVVKPSINMLMLVLVATFLCSYAADVNVDLKGEVNVNKWLEDDFQYNFEGPAEIAVTHSKNIRVCVAEARNDDYKVCQSLIRQSTQILVASQRFLLEHFLSILQRVQCRPTNCGTNHSCSH